MASNRGWQFSGKLDDGRFVKTSTDTANLPAAVATMLRSIYAQMPQGSQLVRFSVSPRRVRGAKPGVAIRATPIND